eukprot:3897484-Prymnesium_polylepis.1
MSRASYCWLPRCTPNLHDVGSQVVAHHRRHRQQLQHQHRCLPPSRSRVVGVQPLGRQVAVHRRRGALPPSECRSARIVRPEYAQLPVLAVQLHLGQLHAIDARAAPHAGKQKVVVRVRRRRRRGRRHCRWRGWARRQSRWNGAKRRCRRRRRAGRRHEDGEADTVGIAHLARERRHVARDAVQRLERLCYKLALLTANSWSINTKRPRHRIAVRLVVGGVQVVSRHGGWCGQREHERRLLLAVRARDVHVEPLSRYAAVDDIRGRLPPAPWHTTGVGRLNHAQRLSLNTIQLDLGQLQLARAQASSQGPEDK